MFKILGADGKEYGPVTAGKLHEWIAAGRANMQTKARRESETEWKTLGDFPELSQFGTTGGTTPSVTPLSPVTPFAAPTDVTVGVTGKLELEPASRWLRLGAVLLDCIIGSLFALPGFCLMFVAGIFTHANQPNAPLVFMGMAVFALTTLVLLGIQFYLLTTRGQTMGKKLLGIKIVNFDDEGNPGFVKAVLLRIVVNGLIGCVPVLGWVYSLVDLCFIFTQDRRCLHDLIAGTKVVKV